MSKFKTGNKFVNLHERYSLIDTLLGGTEAMRAAGTKYLPREPREAPDNYNSRLNRSVLFPQYEKTVGTSVGKIFAKPLNIAVSSELERLITDCDGTGTPLRSFAKTITSSAINYGVTYVLVDYPILQNDASLEDERAAGAYPYFVEIKPTSVLDLSYDYILGIATLTSFRFYEEFEDEDGKYVEQVKEFTLNRDTREVTWTIYRKGKNNKEVVHSFGTMVGLNEIPIVPVYGNKTAPFLGSPALYGLAQLNVTHWQIYSDYMNIVHMVQCPMLVVTGYQTKTNPDGTQEEMVISPNTVFKTDSENGDVKWVEVSGNSVNVGKDAISNLESKMAIMGLELVTANTSLPETATGRLLDAAQTSSILSSIAMDVEYALVNMFLYASVYLGISAPTIDIKINTEYTLINNTSLENILKLYEMGLVKDVEVIQWVRDNKII